MIMTFFKWQNLANFIGLIFLKKILQNYSKYFYPSFLGKRKAYDKCLMRCNVMLGIWQCMHLEKFLKVSNDP